MNDRSAKMPPRDPKKADEPIFIGLGANLPSPKHGPPKSTLNAALESLAARGLRVTARSRWYESAPVPASDQPWYVNGVVRVATNLAPAALLAVLHKVEEEFGRVRGEPNAPRILDLDIIAYGDRVARGKDIPQLPHPRMQIRGFVLLPLREIAPRWQHPLLRQTLDQLIAALPPDQIARPLG
jgi:2-amino-4-hydroxy-6-hydroxymethyldihydropteridine diphosphokinase